MAYLGVSPSNGVRQKHTYTATASQTSFSGAGDENITLSYKDSNYVDVYQNGVKLSEADYTATTGTTVVLATGATVNDMIEIIVYDVFSVADTVSKADGGQFDGNVTMAGTLGVTGVLTTTATAVFNGGFTSNGDTNTFTSSAQDDPVVIIQNTTNDSNSARLKFMKDRGAAGQDGDDIADILFNADNDAQEETTFASIRSEIIDASDGTEDGRFKITTKLAGTSVDRLQFNSAETIFNQDSASLDFRVESNGNANMLFVQGSSDNISIGHSAPTFATGNGVHLGDDHFLGFGVGNGTRPDYQVGQVSGTNTLGIRCGTGADTADITIDTTGRFLMGATSAFNSCLFGSVFDGTNFNAIVLKTTRTTNTGSNFLVFKNSDGDTCGFIQQNGTTSTNFSTSSDYRLKENVTYDFDATTRLKQLKPARFNFIADGTDRVVDGFLAHEVSSIVPEAIIGEKDAMTKEVLYVEDDEIPEGKKVGDVKEASKIDPQGIDQSKLVPLLVKTIQELEARIAVLENA